MTEQPPSLSALLRVASRAWLIVLFLCFAHSIATAQVIVFAAHPDDETLIASSVLYQAKQHGETVKVVIVTNGDCQAPAIGHTREQETMAAMGLLGLAADDVIFLGYPDCGLRELYYYYTSPTSQFTSAAGFTQTYAYEGLGRTDYHSYMYGAPASYSGYSLLQDIRTILKNYNPQDIYLTSVYDDSTDHYAVHYLVSEAVLSLLGPSGPAFQPTLHDAIIDEPCELCDPNYHWPMPSFTPTEFFQAPPFLSTTPLAWSEVESQAVPPAMLDTSTTTNLKYQAIARYTSQAGAESWLQAFVKADEIFWRREVWADLALKANATASSFITPGTAPDRMNDSVVAGYPRVYLSRGGRGEWVSNGELSGAWAQLTWSTPQGLTKVVLHDRPDASENITSGTLTFSDGSSLSVGALPVSGAPLAVAFAEKTVTWVRFTVNSASGTAAGLAEFEAFGPSAPKLAWQTPPAGTTPAITAGPTATPPSIDDASTSILEVGAFDADGDPLTYTWTATCGRIEGSGTTVTFVPPIVGTATTCRASVFVADGRGGIATGSVDLTVTTSTAPHNVAGFATATASSANISHGQTPDKAIDGVVSGYPTDAQREWATQGELAGAWIQLAWATPRTVSSSILHDRINLTDQILSGTLRFSDGSAFSVGTLPNDGNGLTVDFPARTVTWIRFEITGARGGSTGLAEWEVYSAATSGGNTQPVITSGPSATPGTITDSQTATLDIAAFDADGDALTYSWQAAAGSITGSGRTVTFVPPHVTTITSVRLDVQLFDGQGGSASGFVTITVTPSDTATNLAFSGTATASSENSSRGQDAAKAIDGVVDGYPTDATREWASIGQTGGGWIQVSWPVVQAVSRAVLHDRINTTDQVLSGTLRFSDGSTIPVGTLPNDGAPLTIDFASRDVLWVRFEIGNARGDNTGLAEIEFYAPSGSGNAAPRITAGPTATPAAITDLETTSVAVTASDADGDPLSYFWTTSAGAISGTGANVTFTPPRVAAQSTFRLQVTVTDGRGGSATNLVDVTVTPSSALPNLALAAVASASTENSSRGQGAAKAIDGIMSGYPNDPAAEWASIGELAGAWLQVQWTNPVTVSRVVLHDRINSEDQILGATLSFSDGSSLVIGALPNDGAPLEIDIAQRVINWMRITVTSARGSNVGTAEVEVF